MLCAKTTASRLPSHREPGSEAQARRMIETLPKGELLSIPGVGHAPSLVEPASLAGLERFLGSVLAPTGG